MVHNVYELGDPLGRLSSLNENSTLNNNIHGMRSTVSTHVSLYPFYLHNKHIFFFILTLMSKESTPIPKATAPSVVTARKATQAPRKSSLEASTDAKAIVLPLLGNK